jgi:hypothetical protein
MTAIVAVMSLTTRHAEIHNLNGNTRGPAIANFVTLNIHMIITAVALTILSVLMVITFVARILVVAIILAISVLMAITFIAHVHIAVIILTISVLTVITFVARVLIAAITLAILSLAVLVVITFVACVLIITVIGLDQGATVVVRNIRSVDPTPKVCHGYTVGTIFAHRTRTR